jgi:hypothetical protein
MKTDWKFEIHDAVWYNDRVGRIEERAIDANGGELYLVQLTNHHYHWVPVKYLEVYIG